MGRTKVKHIMPTADWRSLFPNLSSMEIEDVLCIYKSIFYRMAVGQHVTHDIIDDATARHHCSCFCNLPDVDYVLQRLGYL